MAAILLLQWPWRCARLHTCSFYHMSWVCTHSLPPLSYLTCAAPVLFPQETRGPSSPPPPVLHHSLVLVVARYPELRGPLAALRLPAVGVCALCWQERSWLSLHVAAHGSARLLPRGQGGHLSRALLVSPGGPQGPAGGGEGGTEVGFCAVPAWELAERQAVPQRVQAWAQGRPLRPERSLPTDAGR